MRSAGTSSVVGWHAAAAALECTAAVFFIFLPQFTPRAPFHLSQVVADKTKEYGAKSWGFLKSAYANVATTLEQTAAANGYKVDLGEA